MRGKRILVFALSGGFITFLLCGGIGTCIAVRTWQTLPDGAVTVGRDTTYLDGPLDEDGFVDYAVALNGQMSDGVTPKDNAAVLLLQAFGPPEGNAEYRRQFYSSLDMAPLPADGSYFVTSESLLGIQAAAAARTDGAAHTLEAQEKFWQDYEEANSRPWAGEEFPDLAGWIEMNENPLKLVLEASRRPKCYLPIIPLDAEEGLISASSWLARSSREAVRLLSVRATLHLGEGRPNKAWEDLLAGHRLARHVSQSPMVVDGLTALAVESIVTDAQTVLIHYVKPTREQLAQMMDELEALPPHRPMSDRLVNGERLTWLDSITKLSRNFSSQFEELGIFSDSETGQKVLSFASRSAIDWDEILRTMNVYYDDLGSALEKTSPQDRRQAIQALEAAIDKEMEQSKGLGRIARSFIAFRSPRKTVSRHIANLLVALTCPASAAAMEAEDRGTTRRHLLRISLAIADYRASQGSYPESLATVSDLLAHAPVDPFSAQPFLYRLEADRFLVYSVGPNGRDDEGRNGAEAGDRFDPQADDIALRVPPIPLSCKPD